MKYHSTRSSENAVDSADAIINGLAEDGGLYIPEEFPTWDFNLDGSYRDLAVKVIGSFFTDFTEEELRNATIAYDTKFATAEVAPVIKTSDRHYLELYHGPTSAFKDLALTVLPSFMTTSLRKTGNNDEIVILTATSGDTGKAALEGFKDIDQTRILVFYPKNGVSKVQELQMCTQKGDNTRICSINGNFDDCQTGVKNIFNDVEFNEKIALDGFQLSSANSINIARLIPQVVYYFHSYRTLLTNGEITQGEKVNFVVPTGNFGNILAGMYAQKMGLPVNKFICSSNDNKVLTDFINTGVYNKNRDLVLTTSPSMDILVSSNLERYLYHLTDADTVSQLMADLSEKGRYSLDENAFKKMNLYGNFANESEVAAEIKRVYENENYLIDTHTAVASCVYNKYLDETDDKTKTIIVSTASPYKFSDDVANALELEVSGNPFETIATLEKKTGTNAPEAIKELDKLPITNDFNSDVEDMKAVVENFLRN